VARLGEGLCESNDEYADAPVGARWHFRAQKRNAKFAGIGVV